MNTLTLRSVGVENFEEKRADWKEVKGPEDTVLQVEEGTIARFVAYFAPTGSHNKNIAGSHYDMGASDTALLSKSSTEEFWDLPYVDQQQQDQRAVAKIVPDRITLLARAYANKDDAATEDQARLTILNERIRKLLPAVRPEEFEMVSDALHTVKAVVSENESIRRQLRALMKDA